MKLSKQEILKIAKLARLTLEATEVELYQGQLSAILGHVDQLQNLNLPATSDDMADPVPNLSTLRQDQVGKSLPTDKLLSNAANIENGQFKIPPVFE